MNQLAKLLVSISTGVEHQMDSKFSTIKSKRIETNYIRSLRPFDGP